MHADSFVSFNKKFMSFGYKQHIPLNVYPVQFSVLIWKIKSLTHSVFILLFFLFRLQKYGVLLLLFFFRSWNLIQSILKGNSCWNRLNHNHNNHNLTVRSFNGENIQNVVVSILIIRCVQNFHWKTDFQLCIYFLFFKKRTWNVFINLLIYKTRW